MGLIRYAPAMKLIALGSNRPSLYGNSEQTLLSAMEMLGRRGVRIMKSSRFYKSTPVPVSAQPDFVNAVVSVATKLAPAELLQVLHDIEAQFGRVRTARNAPRILDMDLLAYDSEVIFEPGELILPHPRLHERGFVLYPMRDVAPGWRHPVLKRTVRQMIAALPQEHSVDPLMTRAA